MVEGPKLLEEALAAGAPVEGVYASAGYHHAVLDRAASAGIRVFALAPGVMDRVATTVTPQPVMAVVGLARSDLGDLAGSSLLVVCVDVRDPGNLGTVLRSAEAAGADGVICCQGTVAVHNPKCLRASAGSIFHVPVVSGPEPVEVLEVLGSWGLQRVGTRVSGGTGHRDIDFRRPTAIVLGNEARGLPEELASYLDVALTIPIRGRSESLNVGMAASVLCFEASGQREGDEDQPV